MTSHIDHRTGGGSSYVGPDAVNLYRAVTVASGLRMYARSKMLLTRGATITVLLRIAGEYTGKKYKRGQAELASEDMRVWIETMKAALPTTVDGEPV